MHTPVNILILEDDAAIREFLEMALTSEGYTVWLAESGAHALGIIRHSQPDLMLVDVLMNGMSGLEFSSIYQNLPGPHAPIIGMSASHNTDGLARFFDDFLEKPFDLDEALDCFDKHLAYLGSIA